MRRSLLKVAIGPHRAFLQFVCLCLVSLSVQAATVVVSPDAIVGGSTQSTVVTVTLASSLPNGGYVGLRFSPTGPYTYDNGYIAPGGNSTSFTVQSGQVNQPTSFTVTATYGSDTGTGTLVVNPFQVTLSISPAVIVGGSTQWAVATVTVNAPVNGGGSVGISTSPNNSGVYTYDNGYIPNGGTSTSLTYWAGVARQSQIYSLTATFKGGISAPQSITVNPFQLTLQLGGSLYAGETGSGTLFLDQPTRDGGQAGFSTSPMYGMNFSAPIFGVGQRSANFTYTAGTFNQNTLLSVTATFDNASNAQAIEILAGSDGDLGPSCPCGGGPISFTNGNTWVTNQDYSIPGLGGGLSLTRTWNSLWTNHSPVEQIGMFGDSWRSTYEERLQTMNAGNVRYWRADGSSWTFDFDSVNNIYRQVAPQNEHATLTYNSATGQSTITFLNGDSRIFTAGGYLSSLIDRNGNTTTITRDSNGRVSQVTDAAGRTIQFNYPNQTSHLISSVQDLTGIFATYSYDGSSRLTQVAYPDGGSINYTYDTNSLITSITDANGKVLESHTYDSYRRGLTSVLANGVQGLTVSYPQTGTTHVIDSSSNGTDYTYTVQAGKHVGTGVSGSGCSSCTFGLPTAVTYDSQGNMLSSSDLRGVTTQYTYDSLSDVTSVSRPLDSSHPQTSSYTYNAFSEVLTATDSLSNTTTNTYDPHGNLLTTTTPSPDGGTTPGSTTTFTYDAKGQLLTVTDPLNHTTTFTYTPAGLVQTITDAQNKVTAYGYDARGNRTSITDATNNQTTFDYDGRNRLKKITYPDQTTTQYGYDARGRRTSVTDQNGKVTTYAYDDADRLVSVTDAQTPTHGVTQYGYDTENNLTSIIDALGRVTNFSYDKFRRVKQTTFPSTLSETYTYDGDDNLQTKTDRNGNTITYVYDNLNRMTSKQYPGSGGSVSYTYDLANRLTQVSDPTGTYGFSYDNMGRLTSTTTQYSFLPGNTYTNSYTYDAASNRTGFTAPDGSMNSYSYDTLNRLSTLTNSLTGQFGFGYDALSRRTSLTRPNGVNTAYSYDSLSRLVSILHQSGGTTIDGASYTLDNAGNRTSKLNWLNGITENYTYDPIYQLTQVQQVLSGTPTTTESYTHDAVGNRLSSLNVASYSYNSSNELTSSADGYSYTYDNNGNTLTKANISSTTTYGWDFENRLTSVALPNGGGVVSFKYDPFGKRIQKSGPSGTTSYIYDLANAIEELDSSGNVTAKYAQGSMMDETLAEVRSGVTNYYEADGLGSVTTMTSSAASIAQSYAYTTFGGLVASTGTTINPFQYSSRDSDSETGLVYMRARYFDSNTGEFRNEDPLRFSAGNNFYEYSYNNPVNFKDPTGLQPAPAYIPPPPAASSLTVIQGGSGAAVGGTATGVVAATVGLAAVDLALLGYDTYEGYKLGVAYGWWKPFPHSQPQSNNASCKKKDPDHCLRRYLDEQQFCLRYEGTVLHGMCLERAQWRFSNCQKGVPDPGPLDPLDPDWSID